MLQKDISKENNLRDVISKGPSNALILDNLNKYMLFEGFQLPQMNIFFEKYRGLLLEECVKITMNDEIFEYYKYRPKLLSLRLYGYTDLWHIILWINNMTSVIEFNKHIIYVLDPEYLDTLDRLINMERKAMTENKNNPPVIDTSINNISIRH